ncbi:MAG: Rieske (2Fe-2S) protein [Desulfurococcales archaeon]|nr:Rieske (2Fe-2S) protein [Desulfurococcales archaeon]
MVWRVTISYAALEKAGHAAVKVKDRVVFIAVVNGRLYAMDAVCSHSRCILGELDKEKLTVKCPCHHAVFDLRTGEMLEPPYVAPDVPKEKMKLQTFNVRVNRGFVEVDV